MNIVFVTVNEYIYLPRFFYLLLKGIPRSDTVRCVIVPPLHSGQTTVSAAYRFISTMGFREFFLNAAEMGLKKIADHTGLARGSEPWSVEQAFTNSGHLVYNEKGSINETAGLERLRSWQPDLIISISCMQLFGSELCEIPTQGCLNLHGAPLPRYRGVLPSFWMLKHGETVGAVTLFFINERIDGGDILLQQDVPIHPEDTLRSYIRRSKQVGADVVLNGIEMIRSGAYERRPMPTSNETYFSWPSRQDVREFLQEGRRFR